MQAENPEVRIQNPEDFNRRAGFGHYLRVRSRFIA